MNMKTVSFSVLATLIAAASAQAMAAPVEIKVWRHDTNEKEIAASKAAVERFNKSQNDYKVVMEMIPEGAYTETINAAALAVNCLAHWIWTNRLCLTLPGPATWSSWMACCLRISCNS